MNDDCPTPVFATFLGADFASLAPAIRAGHDVRDALTLTGRASVTRGTSMWSRFLAHIFGFPPVAKDVAVSVKMTAQNGGELWERRFSGKLLRSFLKVKDRAMTESFGPFTFTLGLHVQDGALFYPVVSGKFGPVPLPKLFLPQSIAREYEADGRFHFDVQLRAPLTGGLMVHYQGWLRPERSCLGDGNQKVVKRPEAGKTVL
jgi:hypothetical protein